MSIDYRYKGPMLREGMSLEEIREVKKQAMAHREWLLANMPSLKEEAEKRVDATVGGMGLDRRREILTEAERRLIDDEKRWLKAQSTIGLGSRRSKQWANTTLHRSERTRKLSIGPNSKAGAEGITIP